MDLAFRPRSDASEVATWTSSGRSFSLPHRPYHQYSSAHDDGGSSLSHAAEVVPNTDNDIEMSDEAFSDDEGSMGGIDDVPRPVSMDLESSGSKASVDNPNGSKTKTSSTRKGPSRAALKKREKRAANRSTVIQAKKTTGRVPKRTEKEKSIISNKRANRASKSLKKAKRIDKKIHSLEQKMARFNQRRAEGKQYYSRTIVIYQVTADELAIRTAFRDAQLTLENAKDQLLGVQKRYRILDQHKVLNGPMEREHSQEYVWDQLEEAMALPNEQVVLWKGDVSLQDAFETMKNGKPTTYNRPTH